jgi:hypothetical protein
MIPHPKTMQMVTDQRWHELQVKTHRERLAMITRGQQPGAASRATLRLHVVNAVRLLRPRIGRHLEIGMRVVPSARSSPRLASLHHTACHVRRGWRSRSSPTARRTRPDQPRFSLLGAVALIALQGAPLHLHEHRGLLWFSERYSLECARALRRRTGQRVEKRPMTGDEARRHPWMVTGRPLGSLRAADRPEASQQRNRPIIGNR